MIWRSAKARSGEQWKRKVKVRLSVDIIDQGKNEPCASRKIDTKYSKPAPDFPGYVIFPFQGTREDPEIKNARKDMVFDLQIACPDHLRTEMETALWAFCNFGGLGARTRRGCGALFCKDFAPADPQDLAKTIRTCCKNNTAPHPWPELFSALLIECRKSNAIEAWKNGIKVLQNFRQGADVGRNPGENHSRPARSRWPEPETLRKVTGKRDPKHARMAATPDNGFPRADFGLPIIFHFQSKSDPGDCHLLPFLRGKTDEKKGNRMASPLIIRPLLFKDKKTASMILQLRTPPLEAVELRTSEGKTEVFHRNSIVDKRFASYPNSPLGEKTRGEGLRSKQGSAIEGFLVFAKENGFKEVIQ